MVARYINAACYVATGIIIFVLEAANGWDIKITLLAIAALAYGGYVGLTRRSYWVSTYTYIFPVLAVLFAIFGTR